MGTSSGDPRVGSVLAGYQILSEVGRGGMGVVYLAKHLHLGRNVALKLLAVEFAQNERFRERFIRESRLAASIDHPNVIPIYDAGEVGGSLYIAMRHVEGEDLGSLLAREGPLAPEETFAILGQVAAGLDAAHRLGLVHRDVKPGNILISSGEADARDHVFLTDFGLTKRTDSQTELTGTGLAVGTLSYMAPEQFQGEPLDGRTDVYSLGCVLYECLTGSPPFLRESQAATMYAHLRDPPPAVSAVRADVTAALDGVVSRALAKSKDDRFPTCGDLIGAARSARPSEDDKSAATMPVATKVPSAQTPVRRWIASRRRLLAPATIVVVLMAVVVILLRAGRDEKERPTSREGVLPARTAGKRAVWRPAPGTTWQWQLTGKVDTSIDASLFDIDLFDNDAGVVDALHRRGRKAICYFSAGTFEPWRPDAGHFADSLKGNPVEGFPEERWLDVRKVAALRPIIESRLDLCRQKDFDGVEADNIDGYQNDTGFPIRPDDQLAFNLFLAEAAHARGLSIAFKNAIDALDQLPQLVGAFDFAINEECFSYRECDKLAPFGRAGKAVLHVEYDLPTSDFCSEARKLGFSSMRKRLDLDAWYERC